MNWGIFHYEFVYMQKINKVCINTSDSKPATVKCYTKQELEQLAKNYRGINPLYEEALKYFPEEKLP